MKTKRTKLEIEADAKRTGRPPKKSQERHGILVALRVTQSERKLLDREAKAAGLNVSQLLMRPFRGHE